MINLTEEEARKLFQAMNKEGASTRNLATVGRDNEVSKYDSDDVVQAFEEGLQKSLEVTEEVYKKLGV